MVVILRGVFLFVSFMSLFEVLSLKKGLSYYYTFVIFMVFLERGSIFMSVIFKGADRRSSTFKKRYVRCSFCFKGKL